MTRPLVPPPVIGLACAGGIWLAGRLVAAQAPGLAIDFPGRLGLAATLALAGLTVEAVSVAAFVVRRTTVNPLAPDRASALVTGGLYRLSRNPMYLGFATLLAGFALWRAFPVGLVFVAAFVVILNVVQIAPEERALEEKFGDDYRAYKRRVRRWI